MNNLIKPQVPPSSTDEREVWPAIISNLESAYNNTVAANNMSPDEIILFKSLIQDMKDRDSQGRAKHGVPLKPFNGRNALIDFYQELLDAVAYSRQYLFEIEGLDDKRWRELCDMHFQCVDMLLKVRKILGQENNNP